MKIPCIVIDLKTNKRYTIDQFASELHNGLLKDLVNEKILDNTKLKGRTELLNVASETPVEQRGIVKEKATKAFQAVKEFMKKRGLTPELKFAENMEEMIEIVKEHGGTEADAGLRGFYVAKDGSGVIAFNLERATSDTAGHEPTHPLVDALEASDPNKVDRLYTALAEIEGGQEFIVSAELSYPTNEGMLPKLQERLTELVEAGKTEEANKVKEQITNIENDIRQQKKEAITDFFAKVADGTFEVNQSNIDVLRNYVLEFLKAIGIKLSEENIMRLDQKELINLSKVLNEKLNSGEEITAKDLGLKEADMSKEKSDYVGKDGERITNGKLQQAIFNNYSNINNKTTFEYLKNSGDFEKLKEQGVINDDVSIEDFADKYMFLHSPDNMFSGYISKDGQTLIEGKGGVFYPIKYFKDGHFWASTDAAAESMVNQLNENAQLNNGNVYMALTSAPADKLLSSTTAANGVIDFFNNFLSDKKYKISDKDLKEIYRKAAELTIETEKIKKDADGNIIYEKKYKNGEVVKKNGEIVYTKKPVKVKKISGLGLKIPKNATKEEVLQIIKEKLQNDKSIFEDRKVFSKAVINEVIKKVKGTQAEQDLAEFFHLGIDSESYKQSGATPTTLTGEKNVLKGKKTPKYSLSATNLTNGISEMMNEPMLKDRGTGEAYTVLEIKLKDGAKYVEGEQVVEAVSTKHDPSQHESYGKAVKIVDKSRYEFKLHIIKGNEQWTNLFKETRDILNDESLTDKKKSNELKKQFPTSGVSVRSFKVDVEPSKSNLQASKFEVGETVEETAEKLNNILDDSYRSTPGDTSYAKMLSEAYHKAKADGTNPELVKSVEEILSKSEGAITAEEAASKKSKDVTVIGYHGTSFENANKIKQEGFKLTNKREEGELGIHFGGAEEYSSKYADKGGMLKVDIKLKNPIYQKEYFAEYEKLEREGYKTPDGKKEGKEFTEELRKRLIEKGYDGVISKSEIVVFEPTNENIKISGTPTETKSNIQASKFEIPNAPEEVSIKNAAIDEARAARGAEPVTTQARQTWGKAWDQAVAKINNGESTEVLAAKLAKNPRALNDVEHAMLFINELDLNEKYWNTIDQINKGQGDIDNLNTQLQDIKLKLEDNEYALRASGTETARGLSIRRWSKKANYSADALKAEARAANKGVELDETTKKALEDKAKEIQDAQDAVDANEKKAQEIADERRRKEAEAANNKALKELQDKLKNDKATKEEVTTYIDKRRNRLADLISKRNESKGGIQRAKSELPVDYDKLIEEEIKEIAKGYFALGNKDMDSLVKAVHEDLQGLDPSFTERDVRDAISGYKSDRPKMTKPAIDAEMTDLKAQMKAVSKLEDMSKGLPKQEGEKPTPPAKSKALTDLENQLADKMKEQKLFEELEQLSKEGLPEPKTRGEKRQLSQDIQDLEKMIAEKKKELQLKEKIANVEEGNLPEKGESTKKELSAELQKLQDEYNKKKRLLEISKELEDVRSGNRKAPANKVEVDADVKAAQEQLAEVKRIDDMIKKSAELDRLEQDVNFIKQEIDKFKKIAEDTGDPNDIFYADALQKHLDDLIEQNKKKPKQTKPRTQQEIDLANDIRKKSKELGIDGSDEAKLKAAKTRMQNRITELQRMIDTRNFDKPEKQETVLDAEGLKLKAELEKKKKEADRIIEEERIKNMTPYERRVNWFNKWSRAAVLSGTNVLLKLITAGGTRTMIAKPAEALVGIGLKRLLPRLYKKSVAEGGDMTTFYKNHVKALGEWFRKENWIPDMLGKKLFGEKYEGEFSRVLKQGAGEYDLVFGDKKYGLDDNPLEFFGRLHAALKNPTKRAEWLRSYEYRSLKALEMGEDIDNPDVQYRLGAEAYIDAQKAIFMGDNAISQTYTNFLHSLEARGDGGKATAAFMKLLVPVVKIPTNYVIETLDYTPGVGTLKAIYTIVKNGFDNLTPEQADYIIKLGKKQGVGAAAFAIGMMNSDNIGGYYQMGEKRGRDDVKAMDIRTPYGDVSHLVLHSPLFEIMQMGATYARLHKKAILQGNSEYDANSTAIFEGVTGVTGQIPQAPAIQDLSEALKSDKGFVNFLGSIANRTVFPQLEKDIIGKNIEVETSEGENVKRQPSGFTEQLLKGTGLDTAPIKMGDYVDVSLKNDADFSKRNVVQVLSNGGALDNLTDIKTKRFMVVDPNGNIEKSIHETDQYGGDKVTVKKFKVVTLDREQVNKLNSRMREIFMEKIKNNSFMKKIGTEAMANYESSGVVHDWSKKIPDKVLQKRVTKLLNAAKKQALKEMGYMPSPSDSELYDIFNSKEEEE